MSSKYRPRAEEQEPDNWPEFEWPLKPIETPKAPKTPNPSKKPNEDEIESVA